MSDPLELVSAFLDHDITDGELAELEAWILADPQNALSFARRATVHSQIRDALAGEISLRLSQLRSPELFEPIEGSTDLATEADIPGSMSDAMIMEALVESEVPEASPPMQLPRVETPAEVPAPPGRRFLAGRAIRMVGAIAAVILVGSGLTVWRLFTRPVATLTASVGSVWEQTDKTPALGEFFSRGKTLQLKGGFAEFKYPTGAKIVIEAPAKFILSSRQELTLLAGRLTAQIPAPAHGFTVTTPAGRIVDLGTEFGVNVISDSKVEAQVFVGRIQVQASGDAGGIPLTLAAGQTARLDETAAVLDSTPGKTASYVRDIHQITAVFPTHNTGEGLQAGNIDPNWLVTSVPNAIRYEPTAAQVSNLLGFYVQDDSKSSWDSTSADLPQEDAGLYTFATSFDLSGFDPATAHLHLNVAADDDVTAIRLNGAVTPVKRIPEHSWYRSMHPLDIDGGFVPGVNRLEIIVHNTTFSQMGLKAELIGTAVRSVQQQPSQQPPP